MDALTLIRQLLEQREFPVPLGDGLSVTVRRPDEAGLSAYLADVRNADVHLRCVVGWTGFTEAKLLGPAVGSADPIDFDAALWLTAARDRSDWIGAIAEALGKAITQHMKATEARAKNSTPSSTSRPASSARAKKSR